MHACLIYQLLCWTRARSLRTWAFFVLFFFSIFFPPCPVNGSGYHSFYFFSGFFLYFLLCVNSLDKDFRNIVLKNYIEHCAYKLYDELVRKKSSWFHFHRSCVENLYRQVIFFTRCMMNLYIKVVVREVSWKLCSKLSFSKEAKKLCVKFVVSC